MYNQNMMWRFNADSPNKTWCIGKEDGAGIVNIGSPRLKECASIFIPTLQEKKQKNSNKPVVTSATGVSLRYSKKEEGFW